MKRILLSLFLLAALSGCGGESSPQVATLSVEGMTCENCVAGITGTLANVPGILETRVDLEGEIAWVTYDSRKTNPADIAGRISRLGFPSKVMEDGAEM